jgi:hypothetical protein
LTDPVVIDRIAELSTAPSGGPPGEEPTQTGIAAENKG